MVHTNLNAMLQIEGYRIPIRVGSYVKSAYTKSVFNNFCTHCKNPAGKTDICRNPDCKSEILESSEVDKAFVYGKGDVKIIDKELLDTISKFERKIVVKGRQPKKEGLVTLGGSYILPREFDKKEDFDKLTDAEPFSAYAQLHSSLTNGNDLIVEFHRKRHNIALLRAQGSVIVMLLLPFQEAVNELDEKINVKISKEEKEEARKWIKRFKVADIGSIKDTYRENVEKIITGKIKKVKLNKVKLSKIHGKKISIFATRGKK